MMHVSNHHCAPVHLMVTFCVLQPCPVTLPRIGLSGKMLNMYSPIRVSPGRIRGIFMDITTTHHDNATVLLITGRIDTATAPVLEQAINQEIERQHRKIVLNFSAVSYISSGGLRVLLSTAKKLKNTDDRFALCSLSPEVTKILKLAGFTSIFSIHPSEGEARAGW